MKNNQISENELKSIRNIPIGEYTLREVQMSILTIMVELDRICRKYKIKYVLDGGSMLGAIRHGGFIPWDDDMDVAMLRKDYKKFCKVCKKELNSNFTLESTKTNPRYPYNFAKLKKNGTIYQESFLNNIPIHNGLWVDIFPLDNTNNAFFKLQCKLSRFWQDVRWTKNKIPDCDCFHPRHKRVLKLFSILPFKLINFNQEISIRFLNLFRTKNVSKLCHPGKGKTPHSRKFYANIIDYRFEDSFFYVPNDYDEWLRIRYKDYKSLPKIEDRHPTHSGGKIKL